MNEEDKKRIVIIGAGTRAGLMASYLRQARPDVIVDILSVEEHMAKRRPRPDCNMVIIDEVDAPDLCRAFIGVQRLGKFETSPTYSMKEMFEERRYRKPVRLRGAAAQKRAAKKRRGRK